MRATTTYVATSRQSDFRFGEDRLCLPSEAHHPKNLGGMDLSDFEGESISRVSMLIMHTLSALGLCALLSATSLAVKPTPLSKIEEPESLTDDADAKKADLAYRVCIRPWFSTPIALKLYLTFSQAAGDGKPIATGRFVLKGIEDNTADKILAREMILKSEEVMALLSVIRSQEIFNLAKAPPYTPEDVAYFPKGMDPSTWSFERLQREPDSRYPDLPLFTSVLRTECDSGPAKEVFSAFAAYGTKLISGALPPTSESK